MTSTPFPNEEEKRFEHDAQSRRGALRRNSVSAMILPETILELGVPCTAVIVHTQPLGMRDERGDDIYGFVLTVMADGCAPYEIHVGNPVPAPALPLLYAGSTVSAKRMPDGDERELVIDWKAALAQATPPAA
ncbi:MAG: hypothetical protein ACLP50_37575 [Solirubrobacteraceae bacterium]